MSYPNSGRLSKAKKVHEKGPDYKGSITLERALVKKLLEESEDEVVIKFSGWKKEGQYGPFVSLSYDSYKKPEESKPAPKSSDESEDLPF